MIVIGRVHYLEGTEEKRMDLCLVKDYYALFREFSPAMNYLPSSLTTPIHTCRDVVKSRCASTFSGYKLTC